MTSHELAAMLLSLPDEPVGFMQYMGGDDEWVEVKSVVMDCDMGMLLLPYVDPERS